MSKEFSLPADSLSRWLEQLRSPRAKKVIGTYCPNGETNSRAYFADCQANGKDVCGCAMGQFAYANPDVSYDANGSLRLCDRAIPEPLWERITELNDRTDMTFSQIADWLEANVEPV